MGKIAFVFAGQGAQHIGMGRELYASSPAVKNLFDEAEARRPGTLALMFEGDETELKKTANTQPCLYLADLAAAAALREAGIVPDAVAGFSLGEIPALAFAGAYSDAEGFDLSAGAAPDGAPLRVGRDHFLKRRHNADLHGHCAASLPQLE